MNYSANGTMILGLGSFSTRLAQDERETSPRRDIFQYPTTGLRQSTIGELVDAPVQTRNTGWFGRLSESELAFYVLNNVRGVSESTPCEVGNSRNGRAIRIGGKEYRAKFSKLHEREIAA